MKSVWEDRASLSDFIIYERGDIDKYLKIMRGIKEVYTSLMCSRKLWRKAFAARERYASLSVTTLSSQYAS